MTPDQERELFGTTIKALKTHNRDLASEAPRDKLMFAMSVLSDAQENLHGNEIVRQFINRAKYAISDVLCQFPRTL